MLLRFQGQPRMKTHAREKPPDASSTDFYPGDYDRRQIERARDLIKFAKQVLAESDPSILLRWQMPESSSESHPESRA